MLVEPVSLEGSVVKLAPMTAEHTTGLCKVGLDPSIWEWAPTVISDRHGMEAYVRTALDGQRMGNFLPFVTIERGTGMLIGSTRFGNIDTSNRRVEIGWTWLMPEWQRTAANTEAKSLMLTHAFEVWKCIRVELKTDVLNARSRKAIARLGATEEGVFRQHVVCDTGRFRDSIYFSILDSEWPSVKAGLERKMGL